MAEDKYIDIKDLAEHSKSEKTKQFLSKSGEVAKMFGSAALTGTGVVASGVKNVARKGLKTAGQLYQQYQTGAPERQQARLARLNERAARMKLSAERWKSREQQAASFVRTTNMMHRNTPDILFSRPKPVVVIHKYKYKKHRRHRRRR